MGFEEQKLQHRESGRDAVIEHRQAPDFGPAMQFGNEVFQASREAAAKAMEAFGNLEITGLINEGLGKEGGVGKQGDSAAKGSGAGGKGVDDHNDYSGKSHNAPVGSDSRPGKEKFASYTPEMPVDRSIPVEAPKPGSRTLTAPVQNPVDRSVPPVAQSPDVGVAPPIDRGAVTITPPVLGHPGEPPRKPAPERQDPINVN